MKTTIITGRDNGNRRRGQIQKVLQGFASERNRHCERRKEQRSRKKAQILYRIQLILGSDIEGKHFIYNVS